MRIGEFSKKHKITRDTVRHYISMGLLVPRKDGCHYRFDNTHDKDINKIIELKALDFNLSEIQKVLNFNRLAGKTSKEYNNYYLSILEKKRQEVVSCQKKYMEIEMAINGKIKDLEKTKKSPEKSLGIKIDSVSILNCPICQQELNVNDGSIANNMIMSGIILCRCGYEAYIDKGIYIDRSLGNVNRDAIISKLEFLEAASTDFINFFYDGMSELMGAIKSHQEEAKYILELEKCSGTFLMQYIEQLPKDATYIVINKDKDRLEKLKNNIESDNIHDRFIFICAEFDRLPIRTGSIDVVVDHWMTRDHFLESGEFLLDKLSHLVKADGLLVGSYPCLSNINTDSYIEEFKEMGYFDHEFLASRMRGLGFKGGRTTRVGPLIEDEPFMKERKNKKLYSIIYAGVKVKRV